MTIPDPRILHDAERERDNALAQLAHEQATRREWQTQYQAEHLDYLNDVEADRDRLRDGIRALWLHASERDYPIHVNWLAHIHYRDALRAILDEEAEE